jgi:hypothetical protein
MNKLPKEVYELILDYKYAFEHREKYKHVIRQLRFHFMLKAVLRFYQRILFDQQLFLH